MKTVSDVQGLLPKEKERIIGFALIMLKK